MTESREVLRALESGLRVTPAAVPAFYTQHYRRDHAPYILQTETSISTVTIPREVLRQVPLYQDIALHDITLSWQFSLRLQSIGLVTLRLDCGGPYADPSAYYVSGLYLNPEYRVIPTASLGHLWNGGEERPALVSCDELARAIHRSHFARCRLAVERHRPLRHEMQIPLTVLDIDYRDGPFHGFIRAHEEELADFVFKSRLWETGPPSREAVQSIFDERRLWCPSDNSMMIVNYNGLVYLRRLERGERPLRPVSGFYLTSEDSVVHTVEVGITNYYFLRVADETIDGEIGETMREIEQLDMTPLDTLDEVKRMHRLTSRVMKLQVRLAIMLEELENPDKPIDEEWHIVLLDKVNSVLGVSVWASAIGRRIEQLSQVWHWMEAWRENSVALQLSHEIEATNNRVEVLQPLFLVLALVQLVPFFVELYLGNVSRVVSKYGLFWPSLLLVLPLGVASYLVIYVGTGGHPSATGARG